jgi:predicted phosphoribosyltransferase
LFVRERELFFRGDLMKEVIEEPSFRDKIRIFRDRFHAGALLAQKLGGYKSRKDVLVLAVPAGGVEVAVVIVDELKLALDLAITRKIHVPWNKEAGFGAISWDGQVFLNHALVRRLNLSDKTIQECIENEKVMIVRRNRLFRANQPWPDLKDRTVIVVDDGLASGFSMLATTKALRKLQSREIVVAVPTAPSSAINLLLPHADKIVCLNIRSFPIFAVADAYQNWYDLSDQDVLQLLKRERKV